jgi:hypothetical protein
MSIRQGVNALNAVLQLIDLSLGGSTLLSPFLKRSFIPYKKLHYAHSHF